MSTITDDLINTLEAGLKDKVLSLTGPAQVTVSTKGSFRKKSMIGSEEFIFKGIREGKTSQLIFMVEPVDARDFEHAEFTEKEAAKHITDYNGIIASLLDGFTIPQWRAKAENRKKSSEEKKAAAAVEQEKKTYGAHEMWGMF